MASDEACLPLLGHVSGTYGCIRLGVCGVRGVESTMFAVVCVAWLSAIL